MEYISTQEAADKWDVSLRQVQRLIHDGRIPGVKKYGVCWLIPVNAVKPADPRRAPSAASRRDESSISLLLLMSLNSIDDMYERCRTVNDRVLLDAALACFRCQPQIAIELAAPFYQSATNPSDRLNSGLVLGLANMGLGNTTAWKEVTADLDQLDVPQNLHMERELAVAVLNSAMHGQNIYPRWLEIGAYSELPPVFYDVARMIYVKILYIKWKEIDLLAVAEPLISECCRDGGGLYEIYLRLLAATAYCDHGQRAQSRAHIEHAAALARPLGFISPFVETRLHLPGVMDEALKSVYPEALAPVKKLTQLFWDNWSRIYSDVWDVDMAVGLTPREYEACSLISRGMAVVEIARRMGISKSSVKKYLNVAYSKLNIKDKNELRRVMHT